MIPRRSELTARTPRQAQYLQQMRNFDITFCVGPAGTGKTFLAVAAAVDALERDTVKRIVLTRPAVEAGEKLGFLPGRPRREGGSVPSPPLRRALRPDGVTRR